MLGEIRRAVDGDQEIGSPGEVSDRISHAALTRLCSSKVAQRHRGWPLRRG